jgi:hypothetical protein
MDPKPQESSRTSIYLGGVGLLVLAVIAFFIFGGDDPDPGCFLTTAGIATISEGLTRGHSTASIMAKGAVGATIPETCKSVVASFVEEPAEETEFTFESSTGEIEETANGFDLTEPAPTPTDTTEASRVVDCFFAYRETEFLNRLCLDGVIEP